jgi:hypothetical protein
VAILRDVAAGTLVSYDDVALQALASADLEQARRFVTRHLGQLARDDNVHRELAATLYQFLTHEPNLRATAAAIGIHHNTVANRLRRASELLEEPIAGAQCGGAPRSSCYPSPGGDQRRRPGLDPAWSSRYDSEYIVSSQPVWPARPDTSMSQTQQGS